VHNHTDSASGAILQAAAPVGTISIGQRSITNSDQIIIRIVIAPPQLVSPGKAVLP
jgi:hypothetical protein